ncbi:MAG: hypothetical protein PUC11_05930, partial [Elusimicrobia bacterium]|nr:hypothetical protein [Elusimicrobiota bacterium]
KKKKRVKPQSLGSPLVRASLISLGHTVLDIPQSYKQASTSRTTPLTRKKIRPGLRSGFFHTNKFLFFKRLVRQSKRVF